MLLVLDVGNTNAVVWIFDGDLLTWHWRLSSVERTCDEAGILMRNLFALAGIAAERI